MKSDHDNTHFFFTVGTGTAGRHSNLAQGLVNSIRNVPSKSVVGLIPSASPDSQGIAELVIEELRQVRSDVQASIIGTFTDPDDLLACRREFRAFLLNLSKKMTKVVLTVNPTSGTKQMTTAATLACLDEGMGCIEFITGERVDGVVKTGTERISRVDAARLQAEQKARDVLVLLEYGDYTAAARLAALTKTHFPFMAAATRMLAEWNRLAYTAAIRAASGHDALADARKILSRIREADEISLDRAADLLELCRRELIFNRSEEALAGIYRAVELLCKLRLAELDCPPSKYHAEHLIAVLKPVKSVADDLLSLQRRVDPQGHKTLFFGLDRCFGLLRGQAFALNDISHPQREILRTRNETRFGHGDKCVPLKDVSSLFKSVVASADQQWPELQTLRSTSVFSDIVQHIQKEQNHE